MQAISLTEQLSFTIAFENRQFRFIILDGNEEDVCHKVTDKDLNAFLNQDNAYLFKGRLQLNKTGNNVIVKVKGNNIGVLSPKQIADLSAEAKINADGLLVAD